MKHYIVTLEEANQFLTKHLGNSVASVEALTGGEWSAAYGYKLNGKEYVIRFAASDEDFKKDRKVGEYAGKELHIPQILEVGKALHGFYAISERYYGDFLDELTGEQMSRTLPSLLSTLDQIRNLDLSKTTGYGWWDSRGQGLNSSWPDALLSGLEDKSGNRTYGWREKLQTSPQAAVFKRAEKLLGQLVLELPSERHLIHSDLLYRNVLVNDNKISVVIDWGNSLFGDFLYDVAWLTYWWPWYTEWKDIDIKQAVLEHYASIGLDVPDIEKRLQCYELHIGLTAQAYNAFTERWGELEWNSKRTQEVMTSL